MEAAKNITKIQQRLLMRDMAYEKLKDAIRKGMFKPHTRLIEEKIAGIIGTSRTPVREVFQKLEKDGLIYKRPKGGYAVSDDPKGCEKEYFELLVGLIGYAVFLATININNVALKTLKEILKKEEKSMELKDFDAFYANNLKFYKTLFIYAENKVLFNMAEKLSIENFIIKQAEKDLEGIIKKKIKLHKNIILQIEKRNPYLAEKMARVDLSININTFTIKSSNTVFAHLKATQKVNT